MVQDTLQHMVCYLLLNFIIILLLTLGSLIDGPARLATKLHDSTQFWNVSGELDFLNDWCVPLL